MRCGAELKEDEYICLKCGKRYDDNEAYG